ncbi:type II toxin-antitoxin system VapC family toxin [Citrobacter portucalensis]|uniref:type II toxin-antitoxin system VapC family toxin n=1 Tax=Citrobacter portucalensis TaxID=1639133 RepID=UPI001F1512F7|nr:type II toxin-antitoxin system VapC family toxin [Citrobacter portucalensis]|tara:strand:+ start:1582 stop:2115 length:534 start_codon:yes stop_codon:yes gene_type:complete
MSKSYLLDTNILSWLVIGLNNQDSEIGKNVLNNYQAVQASNIFICSATTGEIIYGLEVAPPPNDVLKQKEVQDILDIFKVVFSIDKNIAANHYALLRAKIFKKYAPKDAKQRAKTNYIEEWCDPTTGKNLGINENDVWIAAVALAHNLTLVTADKMDHIISVAPPNLSIENWTFQMS